MYLNFNAFLFATFGTTAYSKTCPIAPYAYLSTFFPMLHVLGVARALEANAKRRFSAPRTTIFHEFNAQANEFNLALPMVHEFNFNAGEFILQVSFLHREISPNAYDKKEPIKFSRSDPKILVRTGAQK